MPLVHYENEPFPLTTAQLFALWRSIGECYPNPAFGLNFGAQADFASFPLSTLAAYHARDYRDSLARQVRFNQFCSPVDIHIEERKDECVVETHWRYAVEDEPPLLADTTMSVVVEHWRMERKCSE